MSKKKEEKIIEAVIEEKSKKDKPYFFPRMIAFIIDIILVSVISTLIVMVIPENENHKKYVEEYEQIQADYIDKKISEKEYINKSKDVVYDIDYTNTPSTIVQVVVLIGYFIVFQFYNKGQTLGKKIMKLRVVSNEDKDLTLNQVAYRAIIVDSILINILMIGAVLFIGRDYYYYTSFGLQGLDALLIIIALVMIIVRKDGRGLHDVIAKTKVISCK